MNTPSITFCTGVGTVTGANFLLKTAQSQILIDCGMVQEEHVAEELNREAFAYTIADIDALLITHAHLDHVGRIPKLVKEGYLGPIYSTPQTKALAEIVLADAVNLAAADAERHGLEPLYGPIDVQTALDQWKTIEYHHPFTLTDDVSVFLKDAGHILGSSMFEFSVTQDGSVKKILFTGDLGNSPAPLLRDTESVGDVDYLVMESVYGDRNHDDRSERTDMFATIIKDTIARSGTLVIPAFSIDRTQVLLYELNNMVERHEIPSIPVFVDSPMAIKATQIYRESEELFNDAVTAQIKKGDDIFAFKNLEYTMTRNEAVGIDKRVGPKIILAGSGMSVGGRIVSHEAFYLPDPRATILLVGYQSAGSLGRRLVEGAKKVTIHGQVVAVKATIKTIYGYSAHKDGDHLVDFVGTASDRLKKVFVVMGEPGASLHLAQRLNDELHVHASVPDRLTEYGV